MVTWVGIDRHDEGDELLKSVAPLKILSDTHNDTLSILEIAKYFRATVRSDLMNHL